MKKPSKETVLHIVAIYTAAVPGTMVMLATDILQVGLLWKIIGAVLMVGGAMCRSVQQMKRITPRQKEAAIWAGGIIAFGASAILTGLL